MKKIYEKNGQKWKNEYFDNGEHIVLKISKEETDESYDVLIDYCDLEKVKLGQWFVFNKRKKTDLKDCYSIMYTKRINKKQHNFDIYQWLLDTKGKDIVVDHINRNRFDNRRSNLRFVTNSDNSRNMDLTRRCKDKNGNIIDKDFKGYRYEEGFDRYLVRININRHVVNIGRYKMESDANAMYLKVCIIMGYDKISDVIKQRIIDNNIILTEDDYNNKYIQKVIAVRDGTYEFNKSKQNRAKKIKLSICGLKGRMKWQKVQQ